MKEAELSNKGAFSSVPTFLTSLVPVFKSCPPCPVCMPKYAAILSFFGIPLADYSHYLTPLMLISMAFTLWSLYHQAKKFSYNLFPFSVGLSAAFLILVARFVAESMTLTYFGMAFLFASIIWNQMRLQKAKGKHSHCCG